MTSTGVSETGARAPAVRQAFLVLDELVEAENGLRFNEIVHRVRLPKSTVHRILHTLLQVGVVVRDQRSEIYCIGSRMGIYSERVVSTGTGLLGVFYALAEQLRDQYDETIQLGVLTGSEVTFIAHVDSSQPVRLFTQVGRRLPAHASATGKALLAFRDAADLGPVLDAGLPALTPRTIIDPDELRRHLGEVRRQGCATEVEEASANLSCYSAPVLDQHGSAVAAVTACVANNAVPVQKSEELSGRIVRVAAEMSRYL